MCNILTLDWHSNTSATSKTSTSYERLYEWPVDAAVFSWLYLPDDPRSGKPFAQLPVIITHTRATSTAINRVSLPKLPVIVDPSVGLRDELTPEPVLKIEAA